jgi:cytolysin (calcineurin-like family phosphatase)
VGRFVVDRLYTGRFDPARKTKDDTGAGNDEGGAMNAQELLQEISD